MNNRLRCMANSARRVCIWNSKGFGAGHNWGLIIFVCGKSQTKVAFTLWLFSLNVHSDPAHSHRRPSANELAQPKVGMPIEPVKLVALVPTTNMQWISCQYSKCAFGPIAFEFRIESKLFQTHAETFLVFNLFQVYDFSAKTSRFAVFVHREWKMESSKSSMRKAIHLKMYCILFCSTRLCPALLCSGCVSRRSA